MDREIKFRGKNKFGWHYGYFTKDYATNCWITSIDGEDTHLVEESTIGQFIANNSKQDFYLGDKVINPQGRIHEVVVWDNIPCLHYKEKGRDYYSPMTVGFLNNKTVIGNIHEIEVTNV